MSSDPLRLLWDALDAQGYGPRGKAHDFRARCPGHGGDNPTSLRVGIGADGRAVLWCHAHQCHVQAITAALGLAVPDLFPDGHHLGRRHRLERAPRSEFTGAALEVVNVLYALETLGEPYQVMVACRCPNCGAPDLWLTGGPERVTLDCPNGCAPMEFLQAFLGRLNERGAS